MSENPSRKINDPSDFRPETLSRLENLFTDIVCGRTAMGFLTFTEEIASCCRHDTNSDSDEEQAQAEKTAVYKMVQFSYRTRFAHLLRNAHFITLSTFLQFRAANHNGTASDTLIIIYRGFDNWFYVAPNFYNHFEGPDANDENRKCDRLYVADPHEGFLTENVPSRFLRFNMRQVTSSYKRVLGIGVFGGGSVALMNSDLCTATLTFSPQTHPKTFLPDIKHDQPWVQPYSRNVDSKRYGNQYQQLLVSKVKESTGRHTVCIGTAPEDIRQVECLRDLQNVEIKQFSHDTHYIAKYLKNQGLLREMITEFVKSG